MLNELFALSNILKTLNIEPKEWHPNLKKLPRNNPCFRIWISKDSSIKGIEKLDHEKVSILRKYELSNGQSFPSFNCPRLWIFNKKDKNEIEKKEADILTDWKKDDGFCLDKFKVWTADSKQKEFFNNNKGMIKDHKSFDNYIKKRKDKLEICTKKTPKILKSFIPLNTKNVLSELIEILLHEGFDFQEKLKSFILDKLEKKDDYNTILEFLLEDNVSVILDFKEWLELDNDLKYPITHERSIDFINEILLKNEKNNEQENTKKDAFGDNSSITTEKLLGPTLPQIGNLILRSMTSESPCHARYGKIENESYPISKNNVVKIKKAIEWLCSNERKGKNWTVSDSKELLFAYPSKLCEIKLIDMFGGSDDEDSDNFSEIEASFESKAEKIIEALTKLSTIEEPIDIELFAIKSIDDGHKNISYYRNYSAQNLIDAAENWKSGCKNIPAMDFEPKIPFPLDIAKLTNKLYKMDGSENNGNKKLKSLNSYQGLNLMLENCTDLARHILGILQGNCIGLVKQLSRRIKNRKIKLNKDYFYIFSLFGLLLYKIGIKKEYYMEKFPYLFGQTLKISDELHALWCEVVRKGDLPPQLAGNSLFISALETPVSALVQLARRINPYLSWAKQYRTKKDCDKSGLAGWYLKLYEENFDKLKNVLSDKNITLNDAEKAQLFIGYLASFPKKEKTEEQK